MRSPLAPPVWAVVLETTGIVLLVTAYLALRQYVSLPAPLNSATAAIVMLFIGIALMLPAAVMLLLAAARQIAPALMNARPSGQTHHQDKEKRDDADH